MTETPILDERAVSEIEDASEKLRSTEEVYSADRSEWYGRYLARLHFDEVVTFAAVSALCATVKHLWGDAKSKKIELLQLSGRRELLAKEHVKFDELDEVAAVRNEFDRLRNIVIVELQSQLEQLRAENERLKAPRIRKTDLAQEGQALLPRLFANPRDLESIARVPELVKALCDENNEQYNRIVELERRLRIPFGKFPCALCGGPHDFDTSIPSVAWNAVVRARNLPDYLCTTCIVREFVRVGQGFTAELWNEEFNGVPIEVVVNGQNAKDASLVQQENNSLRNRLAQLEQERDRILQLYNSAWLWVQQRVKHPNSGLPPAAMTLIEMLPLLNQRAIQICKDKAAEWEQKAKVMAISDENHSTPAIKARAATELASGLEKL